MPSDKYQIIKHSESETLLIEMKMITGFITGADSKKNFRRLFEFARKGPRHILGIL